MSSITEVVHSTLLSARAASRKLAVASTAVKNAVLERAAASLIDDAEVILAANERDVAAGQAEGMDDSLVDRLRLDRERLEGIAGGLSQLVAAPDPVGEVLGGRTLPNGLRLQKVRVPLGVMGMIYEARPNVTVDAFGLALKSGNAAVLRGSRSAEQSNRALVALLQDAAVAEGLPRECVQLLPVDYESIDALLSARGLVDVVIPRGGAGLIERVVTTSTVPVIETGTGNCHVFVDRDADVDMAIKVLLNGKTRRVSVCNATETVLVDAALPAAAQQRIVDALESAGVRVHAEQLEGLEFRSRVEATERDWQEEYLSMDIALARVDGVDAAVDHIARFSSGHTDAIVTDSVSTADYFVARVDSAVVNVNASTAFSDGEQFGMGAEIGISTQKLHARGPMGLPELTSMKWIVRGDGHTRP